MFAIAVSAFAGMARADGPNGLAERALEAAREARPQPAWGWFASGSPEGRVTAGATFRNNRNWTTRLFVSHLGPRTADEEDGLRLRSSSTVGAALTGKLALGARVSFEVFNVFDHERGEVDYFAGATALPRAPGGLEGYLSHPAEGRGFRVRLSTTF